MGLLDKHLGYRAPLDAIRAVGADPSNVRFEAVTSPTEGVLNGRPVILLGTNNYLGLTFDPECIEASAEAVRQWGTGTTGSRFANGTFLGHTALEHALAGFYGRKHAMVFTTGYQANLGSISGLVGRGDHLILDADSHASIYDAAKLSGAEVIRFRHNDPEDLYKRLRRLGDAPGGRLIVVEGIYSMIGDVAPLKEFVDVKREMGGYLLVDEAHSMGVLGENGRGLAEEAGVGDALADLPQSRDHRRDRGLALRGAGLDIELDVLGLPDRHRGFRRTHLHRVERVARPPFQLNGPVHEHREDDLQVPARGGPIVVVGQERLDRLQLDPIYRLVAVRRRPRVDEAGVIEVALLRLRLLVLEPLGVLPGPDELGHGPGRRRRRSAHPGGSEAV